MTEDTIGNGSNGFTILDDNHTKSLFAQQQQPTLRDRFAMAALTGLVSASENAEDWSWRTGSLTGDAYLFADAMMEARKL